MKKIFVILLLVTSVGFARISDKKKIVPIEYKYFQKVYVNDLDKPAFGTWKTGDGINYDYSGNTNVTIKFISKEKYKRGCKIAKKYYQNRVKKKVTLEEINERLQKLESK